MLLGICLGEPEEVDDDAESLFVFILKSEEMRRADLTGADNILSVDADTHSNPVGGVVYD